MRISDQEAKQALSLIAASYGDAGVWLFGSRADDAARGGDVDLFVESNSKDAIQKIRCKSALTDLFDLKVDLVVGTGNQPIHRIAKATGIRLR